MAIIKPFKGIRPGRDKAHLVVSRAVNTYKKNILHAKLEENPFTFLHVILPEFGKKTTTKPNSIARFNLVKEKYQEFIKEKILLKDKKDSLYIYKQIKDGVEYLGLIGGASVDDYHNGKIKIHEQTLTKRVEVFTNYLEVCKFNAEPVLLTYNDDKSINSILKKYNKQRPEYEFTTADKVSHYLWVIDSKQDLEIITKAFKKMESIYIADGHHRTSSSSLLSSKINSKKKKPGMHNYFLALYISKSHLKIYEYNRFVKDLNGLSSTGFLKKLERDFEIKKLGNKNAIPKSKHEFGIYLDGNGYILKLKKGVIKSKDPISNLDAQILNEFILGPVLNIKDLKTDQRISFSGGKTDFEMVKKNVDSGKNKIAFILFPASVDELMNIANHQQIMPPKSTYIEPKLRSGLVIQPLD